MYCSFSTLKQFKFIFSYTYEFLCKLWQTKSILIKKISLFFGIIIVFRTRQLSIVHNIKQYKYTH